MCMSKTFSPAVISQHDLKMHRSETALDYPLATFDDISRNFYNLFMADVMSAGSMSFSRAVSVKIKKSTFRYCLLVFSERYL